MPVSIARLRELIDLAGSEGVGDIDILEDGTRIRIVRASGAPARRTVADAPDAPVALPRSLTSSAATPVAARAADDDILAAPMFGVFHLTPAPGAKPFVAVGDRIANGQQLCLIEAMKMFTAFHSDRAGRLEAILAEPGAEVASGQPLFRISRS